MIVNEISLVIQNWISIINISYKPTINIGNYRLSESFKDMIENKINSWLLGIHHY